MFFVSCALVKLGRDLTRPMGPQKVAFGFREIPGYFREISVGDILFHLASFDAGMGAESKLSAEVGRNGKW